VGAGSMGSGFVWLYRSKCGSERIGREVEGKSSGRAEMGTYAAILRRTPDHEDLLYGIIKFTTCTLVTGSCIYVDTFPKIEEEEVGIQSKTIFIKGQSHSGK
jgi:hypothetical protein